MSRLDKWKDSKRILSLLTGSNEKLKSELSNTQEKTEYNDQPKLSETSIIQASKEIIFDIEDNNIVFYYIMHTFDTESGYIELSPSIASRHNLEDGDNKKEIEESILKTLALAVMNEVPVYPNHERLIPDLSYYRRKMLIEGFTVKESDEEKKKYYIIKSPGEKIDDPYYIKDEIPSEQYSPVGISVVRNSIVKELKNLETAEKLLITLKKSIKALELKLNVTQINENELQHHLTNNPVLFGLDYIRVIPEYKQGSEHKMNYALEKHLGLHDIVELESSNLNLYTKEGIPGRDLVHAEQRVLDWLEWTENHNPYAYEKFQGLLSPQGFVIIGTESLLNEQDKVRLKRRNSLYGGKLQVLTYDDLLKRAKKILSRLESLMQTQ